MIIDSTIGEITKKIQTGKTPPTSNEEYFNGEYNWYTPSDLNKKFLETSIRTITNKSYEDRRAIAYPKNTILLSCIGDIGKIGITIDETSSSNQQITGLILDEDKIIPEYFYYWCISHKYIFEKSATNAIVPILNNKRLKNIKVWFDEDKENQKKIANLLSQIENLIQKREKSIELLDKLVKSTFLDMFGDRNKFQYKTIDQIASNEKYSLSSGPFGSSLTSQHYTSKGVIILRGKNITSGKVDLSDVKFVSEDKAIELKRSEIKPNDIVIIAVGSSGYALRIPETLPRAIISQNFNKITPNTSIILPIYLEYIINSEIVQTQFKKVTVNGGRSFLSLTNIKKIEIPCPPKDLQDKFANIVIKIENTKKTYQKSLDELNQLFDSVSQKAFKGELDLSDIQNISNQAINQSKVSKKKKQIVRNRIKVNLLSRKRTTTKSDFTKEYFENILNRYTIKGGKNIYSFKNKRRFERFLKKLFNKGMPFYLLFELCESYKILIPYDDKFKKENDDFTYKEVIYDFLKDKEIIQRIREYKKDGKLKREMILRARR